MLEAGSRREETLNTDQASPADLQFKTLNTARFSQVDKSPIAVRNHLGNEGYHCPACSSPLLTTSPPIQPPNVAEQQHRLHLYVQ